MEKISLLEFVYTGTQVNYYFICRRKLWPFNFMLKHFEELVYPMFLK